MPSETRDRIVHATAALLQRGGYAGTGLKRVSLDSGAPFGSLYHFFPGGKEELAAEALRWSGSGYQLLVEGIFDGATDLQSGIEACFTTAAEVLAATDYADACPIETVALEVASTNEHLRIVTAEIFEEWVASAAVRGEASGLTPAGARRLAFAFVGALEGAFVLARAMKSPEALLAASAAMVAATRAALTEVAAPSSGGQGRAARESVTVAGT